ncbi:MAG: patatin-like phospholipase family protein [Myxococcota bacterium]
MVHGGRTAACILAMVALAGAASAEERPRIGLVLGGGGARGLAHIGVIETLESLQIPIDFIAGTSMGAVVGGLYASGLSPAELRSAVLETDWADVFEDSTRRQHLTFRRKQDDRNFLAKARLGIRDGEIAFPRGLLEGQKLNLLLRILTLHVTERDFDALRIPFRAVATDIASGEVVILREGDLPRAIRASMAIPGVFEPVDVDQRVLVDGLVAMNLPVAPVRDADVDVVIAVDVGTPIDPDVAPEDLFGIADQVVNILTRRNTDEQIALLGDDDVFIRPDLEGFATVDFERGEEGIARGLAAAEAQRAALARLSVGDETWRAYLTRQRREPTPPPRIDAIRIENTSPIADEVIAARIHAEVGAPLALGPLERDLALLYGMETFERVTFHLEPRGDGAVLVIDAEPRHSGPHYVRAGVNLEEDFDTSTAWNIALNHTWNPLNRLGGEWRNQGQVGSTQSVTSEFYQPLDWAGRWFVAPRAAFERTPRNVFASGRQIGEVRITGGEARLDVGRNLGNWAELRVGIVRGLAQIHRESGALGFRTFDLDRGAYLAELSIDTLDLPYFPENGVFANGVFRLERDHLGSDTEYESFEGTAGFFQTWGKNTIGGLVEVGTTLDEPLPIPDQFTLGGFLDLSGFARSELVGQHRASAAVLAYRKVAAPGVLSFTFPLYLGGSLEAGGVWDRRGEFGNQPILAGSVFAGADTPLGPLYLAYGQAEGGNGAVYLFLGATF